MVQVMINCFSIFYSTSFLLSSPLLMLLSFPSTPCLQEVEVQLGNFLIFLFFITHVLAFAL
ncbi:unnamed protein product, partial [Vitis vinifera]